MNTALEWPALKGVDMTSPAAIEQKATRISCLENQSDRHAEIAELEQHHSKNIARMIERRAKEIYQRRGHGR